MKKSNQKLINEIFNIPFKPQDSFKSNCYQFKKMKLDSIVYKDISMTEYTDLEMLEFCFKSNGIQSDSDFILRAAEFIEFLGHYKPKYILVTNIGSGYAISDEMINFVNNIVLSQIIEFQTRKIFIISDLPDRKIKSVYNKVEYCDSYEYVFINIINNNKNLTEARKKELV